VPSAKILGRRKEAAVKEYNVFELTFWGGTKLHYRRWHTTIEKAKLEARRAHAKMSEPAAHPAIIYDKNGEQVCSILP
jgi:hypothetical protein